MPTTTLFEVSPTVPTLVKAFNSVAQTYEKFRPGYPLQLQEFLETRLNMSSSSRVLDLAAGTGKVSRVLEKVCGVENLVAVEPLDGMRSELTASLPSVSAFPGTAESIPLPDASVDFVVVGDAFHWFRGQEAVAEILRVLKPGGQLCVMWNDPDVTNGPAFMKTLFFNVVGSRKPAGTPTYWSGEWKAPFQAQNSPFSPLQFQRIQHSTTMTPQQVIKFVSSLSWIAALTSEQAQIEEETCAAIAADPVNCNKDIFMVPYNTDVYWCTKL